MTKRVPYEKGRNLRKEFDNTLGVLSWAIPGKKIRHVTRTPGAPAWWQDDEEASQSFLKSMGVVSI